jgi:Fe-S-cluster containining protein
MSNNEDGDEFGPFHCGSCGACCAFKWSWPVLRRDRSDAVGIPAEMLRTDYPLMRTDEDARCVALQGEVGRSCRCAVYADRPSACRNFNPGGMLCREARRAKLKSKIERT